MNFYAIGFGQLRRDRRPRWSFPAMPATADVGAAISRLQCAKKENFLCPWEQDRRLVLHSSK